VRPTCFIVQFDEFSKRVVHFAEGIVAARYGVVLLLCCGARKVLSYWGRDVQIQMFRYETFTLIAAFQTKAVGQP